MFQCFTLRITWQTIIISYMILFHICILTSMKKYIHPDMKLLVSPPEGQDDLSICVG